MVSWSARPHTYHPPFCLQGVSTVTGFLEYSLSDKFELPVGMAAERAVALALAPMLLMSVVSSVAAGWISDLCGKRRKVSARVHACHSCSLELVHSGCVCTWQ